MGFFKFWKRNSDLDIANRKLKEADKKIEQLTEESNKWENRYRKALIENSDFRYRFQCLEEDNEHYKESIKTLENMILKYSTYVFTCIKKESDSLPNIQSPEKENEKK